MIAYLFPTNNATGDDSCDLCENEADISIGNHDYIPLVLDTGRVVERCAESASFVIDRLNAPSHRAAIHMNVKNRKKYAKPGDTPNALNFYDPAIRGRNNHAGIGGYGSLRIPEKEGHKGSKSDKDDTGCDPAKYKTQQCGKE